MGLLATAVNWTTVIVTGVPAIIGALFAGAALIIASLNRRQIRAPSGETIGALAERTHDLAVVNATRSARIDKAVNGDTVPPETLPRRAADA